MIYLHLISIIWTAYNGLTLGSETWSPHPRCKCMETTTHRTTFSSGCKGLGGDHYQKISRNGTCRDRLGTHSRKASLANRNNKTLKLDLVEFLKWIVRWTKRGISHRWLCLGRVTYRFHHCMKWRIMTKITSYHQATIVWRQQQWFPLRAFGCLWLSWCWSEFQPHLCILDGWGMSDGWFQAIV